MAFTVRCAVVINKPSDGRLSTVKVACDFTLGAFTEVTSTVNS